MYPESVVLSGPDLREIHVPNPILGSVQLIGCGFRGGWVGEEAQLYPFSPFGKKGKTRAPAIPVCSQAGETRLGLGQAGPREPVVPARALRTRERPRTTTASVTNVHTTVNAALTESEAVPRWPRKYPATKIASTTSRAMMSQSTSRFMAAPR